jgi:anti-sigma28 factor (negative regulator of flagellin synthesis)
MRIVYYEGSGYPLRPDYAVYNSNAAFGNGLRAQASEARRSTLERVELSLSAHALRRAREIVQVTPDIRAQRVSEAQQALTNQTLTLQGEVLADRVLANEFPTF